MPYWDTLGRSPVAQDTQENADRIANFLSYSGLDAIVSSGTDDSLYTVTVPTEQEELAARRILEMEQFEEDSEERAASYREQYLSHSPAFVPPEEKFRYSTNSSITFFCAGIVVVAMALLHFLLILYQQREDNEASCLVELFLGFIFILFSITTHQKVRFIQDQMMEENAFTNEIIRWCTTLYPAEHLDKCIDAASDSQDLSEEDRFFLRRQLIQNYILREYDISDSAYLDYLTDMIYKKLYYPNALSTSEP